MKELYERKVNARVRSVLALSHYLGEAGVRRLSLTSARGDLWITAGSPLGNDGCAECVSGSLVLKTDDQYRGIISSLAKERY